MAIQRAQNNIYSWEYNQVFFISTARELSVNIIDLQAQTLAGPPQANLGAGPTSCTTPQQPTLHIAYKLFLLSDTQANYVILMKSKL